MNGSARKRYRKKSILAFIGESKSESERGTKGVEREGEEEVHTTIYLLNILLFYFIINHECLP
jgi:hypothetical protein